MDPVANCNITQESLCVMPLRKKILKREERRKRSSLLDIFQISFHTSLNTMAIISVRQLIEDVNTAICDAWASLRDAPHQLEDPKINIILQPDATK